MAERSLVQFTVMFLKETVRSPYVKIHKNLHTHAYSCIGLIISQNISGMPLNA